MVNSVRVIPHFGHIDDREVARIASAMCAYALSVNGEAYSKALSAQPVSCGYLLAPHEDEAIGIGWESPVCTWSAVLQTALSATSSSLLNMFCCVGFGTRQIIDYRAIGDGTSTSSSEFADNDGGTILVPKRKLREMFCGARVKLVFANSSQYSNDGQGRFDEGVAQALVSRLTASGLSSIRYSTHQPRNQRSVSTGHCVSKWALGRLCGSHAGR